VARLLYGGTPADFAVALGASEVIPGSDPAANARPALLPEDSVTFLIYDGPGGTQITDLLDASLLPITEVSTSEDLDTLASVPVFYGPDLYTDDLWASADATNFYRLAPSTATAYERLLTVETDVATLAIGDLVDVDMTGAATGEILTVQPDGSIAPGAAGSGSVSSVNGIDPVAGDVTLEPGDLIPAAATASGLVAVADIVGARLLQSGSGYPARPSAAQYAIYIGTATPSTGVQNGDIWLQPVST
jgi:hypothetical protein